MRSAAVLLIVLLAPSSAARAADGAAIVYGLHTPSEEAFQRLLSVPSVRYVCTQQIFTKAGVPELARMRAAALAKAGKRVILQIWWGPDGDFNCAKYSFANVALDEAIRADFFREVVDACIDKYGADNLYGVHLMEETGMHFATDVDRREDPDNCKDFEEDGHPYNAPFWSGYGDLPGGVKIANVRRHEQDFTRISALSLRKSRVVIFALVVALLAAAAVAWHHATRQVPFDPVQWMSGDPVLDDSSRRYKVRNESIDTSAR